ncbi:MAG: phosphate/phosphite/phosphonate ABC transporter substrate-binding protein [Gammaproteobacteria bacterium]|nr:phosphate/phosphite/phosphonate ABC transporter substrate-binding protein [Gammaproteobacteria bacterium]
MILVLRKFIILLFLTLPLAITFSEPLKFISARTHPKELTQKLYTSLLSYLSQNIGKKIELVLPRGYLDYINKMRKGNYDITFDGPHFSS